MIYTTELTDKNYQEFTKNKLTLVDIWAPWCGPCRQISPIVDSLSTEYAGKLSVGKLNADENSEIVTQLGIRSIPAIFIYKEGEIVETMIGFSSKQKLAEVIEKHLM
jgi:thioredoxin 1